MLPEFKCENPICLRLASFFNSNAGDPNYSEIYFWKNYFFHCERAKAGEFCRRKKQNETNTEMLSSSETKVAKFGNYFSRNENNNANAFKHDGDEESLVPVGSDVEGEEDDDSSFVIQSAPNTGDTFATSRSIDDDLVLVETKSSFSDKQL